LTSARVSAFWRRGVPLASRPTSRSRRSCRCSAICAGSV
jgi:hypothetical protein